MFSPTTYQTLKIDDVDMFYRAAGPADAPVLLMLHGFPSSSHQFRNIIPLLSDRYRVIAPDLPGFGSTVAPARGQYDYTFDNLAETVEQFIESLNLDRFALFVFDYGAPIGFRIATRHPGRITALVTQNGNAYEEGLTDAWAAIRRYWADDSLPNRDALRSLLTRETTAWQYYEGVPEERKNLVAPDAIHHDQAILDRDAEIQLDLFRDYRTNVASYPAWQEYLRTHQPPVLAVWGKNDPYFAPAGAHAFKRDVPDARVELIDTGHFALETHGAEIAAYIRNFLKGALRRVPARRPTRLAIAGAD